MKKLADILKVNTKEYTPQQKRTKSASPDSKSKQKEKEDEDESNVSSDE